MNNSTAAISEQWWICPTCGHWTRIGETHTCFPSPAIDALTRSPLSTEPSLEDRVAKLEAYVADLHGAVEELIKAMPSG